MSLLSLPTRILTLSSFLSFDILILIICRLPVRVRRMRPPPFSLNRLGNSDSSFSVMCLSTSSLDSFILRMLSRMAPSGPRFSSFTFSFASRVDARKFLKPFSMSLKNSLVFFLAPFSSVHLTNVLIDFLMSFVPYPPT